jgi:hypothetical protein
MRKIILIAAMALTCAAAQAGEAERNLSPAAAPSDAPVAAPAKPSDTPRYTVRPAPVDNAPATASTEHPERRYDDRGYYDDAGYHPFARRYTDADRHVDADRQSDRDAERPRGHVNRPHYRARWNAARIIAEMHRYGIYW